ncbi:MAG: F0F1 ATP synthase subunit delta [Patescibacteria group bacterium]
MKASWYAEALYRALLEDKKANTKKEAEDATSRFLEIVRARGDAKLLKHIPDELAKVIAREERDKEMILVTADAKSEPKWSHAYDHYEKEGMIPKDTKKRSIIDETIIGGFQIRNKKLLIDGSYKKSLTELYKNIINKNHTI